MEQYWKCRVCGGWLVASIGSWGLYHEWPVSHPHRPDPVRVKGHMINYCYTHERIAAFCQPAILSGEPCDTDESRAEEE